MPRNASNASTMAMIILRVLTICHPLARSSVRGTQGDKTARHVFFHSRRTPGQTVPGHFGYLFPESQHGSLLSRKRKTRIQRHLRSRMRRTRHAAPPIISIAGEYAGFKTTLRRTAMQDAAPGNGKNLPEKTSTDADITKCGQVVQSDACAHHHCGERIIHHKNGQ